MPFTPYHLGPALFFGLLFLSFLDFPTFLAANVVVDIEPLLIMVFGLPYPLHGFFHSLLGGTLVALPLSFVMHKIRNKITPFLSFFKIEQQVSYKKILAAALSGIYLHILLDSVSYSDIQPFFPSSYNPFLNTGALAGLAPLTFCMWSFFGAGVLYGVKLLLLWRNNKAN
jgi:membrane-bound metal-dependent hydrolase YbcI (DUF457 family)